MALSTRTTKINGFVTLKGYKPEQIKETLDKLSSFFASNCDQYACIIHDKDICEDGSLKTPHIHFVADLKHATRLSTTLNNIATSINVDPLAVTIEKYTSFEGSTQYLIHQNNPEKAQYDRSAIVTNISKDDLANYLDLTVKAFDIDLWISICMNAHSIDEVIRKIGISYYNMYRNTICDLFRQFHDGNLYGLWKPAFNVEDQF